MDRINRALCGVEDNAVAINELRSAVKSRTRCNVLDGVTKYGITSFGKVAGCGVIVAFEGDNCALLHGDEVIAKGPSPLFGICSDKLAMLRLDAARDFAHAFVVGATQVK